MITIIWKHKTSVDLKLNYYCNSDKLSPHLFLSDIGTVLKVVSIPKETWHDLEEVLLEEMTVFGVSVAEIFS